MAPILSGVLVVAIVAAPQQGLSPQHVRQALSEMQSEKWDRRAAAVKTLAGDREKLQTPEVRQALVSLLEHEHEVIAESLQDGGASTKFGEEYGEYYSGILLRAVDDATGFSKGKADAHTVQVLAKGAYNSDSPFVRQLSTYGEFVVSTALELAGHHGFLIDQDNGLSLVGELIRSDKAKAVVSPLSPSSLAKARAALREGARSHEDWVRHAAVRGLGIAGDRDVLPLLQSIARSDLATYGPPTRLRYFVREEAQKAIVAILATSPR
jgi:hypothetical protein